MDKNSTNTRKIFPNTGYIKKNGTIFDDMPGTLGDDAWKNPGKSIQRVAKCGKYW